MANKIILDTNIWVYLYGKVPIEKSHKSRSILLDNLESIIISTQILGELYHVLTRKKIVSLTEAKNIIIELSSSFLVAEIDTIKVLQALDINSKYQYSYWDSLIIATALNQNCSIIYSEDMQSNQLIENKTRIINPFI
jgi:predicted nucleic acid-binding protein